MAEHKRGRINCECDSCEFRRRYPDRWVRENYDEWLEQFGGDDNIDRIFEKDGQLSDGCMVVKYTKSGIGVFPDPNPKCRVGMCSMHHPNEIGKEMVEMARKQGSF